MPPEVAAYRLGVLEESINRQRAKTDSLYEGHSTQAITLAQHEARIHAVEEAITGLTTTVDKAIWALVGFAFTVAAAAVAAVIALAGPVG